MKIDLLKAVEDSFSTYAAMTIQNRALIDARDGLKPAARQCMYAQFLDKITYKKPYKKSHKSVASAMDHVYVHGDSSCYQLMTRLAKNFTMRYPLEDFKGNYGTISESGNEAAARYTEMRLGELGCLLFDNISKDSIDIWFNNYDDTEQFPSVTPSLGFYNICNGSLGIATSLSSSIPQFNLVEVNNALIKLLWNPDIDFDEIYCPPDFCTGGTILNANEVKESLKVGNGKSAIIRGVVEYNESENCLYITEVPYGVYISTIIGQIKKSIEEGFLTGIKKVDDLSGREANLKISLEKNVNVNKIVRQLYKLTSIQESYSINMMMLDKGTSPRIFSWREALQAHLNHEIDVRIKIHKSELKKIAARLNVIDGILIAIANIDEVVHIIKSSNNKVDAKSKLIERFNFNEPQVEAILKMTLSRLINLEVQSFKNEKEKLLAEQARIEEILTNKELLYKEIEAGLKEVISKYGDNRKTRLINLDFKNEAENAEPIEKKELLIYYTNLNNIYTFESSTLVKTRRGGKGTKVKLAKNEAITKVIREDNLSTLLVFTNIGKMYHLEVSELPINSKINISQLFEFDKNEKPTTITTIKYKDTIKYFVFITKNGMIKKTLASEYEGKRGKSLKAINLKNNDEVIKVLFMNNEKVGILTYSGNFVIINTEDIKEIGRTTAGIKAIKLSEDDFVIDAQIICDNCKSVITLSERGLIKKTSYEEFPICNRNIKGKKISDVRDGDKIVKFLTINQDCVIIITTKKKSIKISTSELRLLSRNATGVKSIDIDDNDIAIDINMEQW